MDIVCDIGLQVNLGHSARKVRGFPCSGYLFISMRTIADLRNDLSPKPSSHLSRFCLHGVGLLVSLSSFENGKHLYESSA